MKEEELRKSILQMAIQGKLVEQDPNDEPASVLLERIREEKQKLIKEGKIKKDKDDSYIFKGDDNRYYEKIGKEVKDITDELPFEIPDSWAWCRLDKLALITAGGTPERKNPLFWNNGNIPWLKISDITSSNKYVNSATEYITQAGMENSSAKLMEKGTILYTIFATIGEVGILNFQATCNQAIAGLKPFLENIKDYLYYYLVNLQSFMKSISKGCAQLNINQSILKSSFVPMPPLNEQEKIVLKLEKIEPLLENYRLLEIEDGVLDANIFNTLKKSVLQYAIQGKLVPQDENDEPASVLLERIRAEKKAKLGKKYVDSYIYKGDDNCYYEHINGKDIDITDKIPFEISSNWSWCKLPHIGHSELGKTMDKGKNTGEPREYLCSINVYWNEIKLDKIKQALFENNEIDKYTVQKGDLLICEGGDVGRCAIWDRDNKILYQNALHRVRFFNNINPKYFMYVIILFKANNIIDNHSKGLTIKHLVQNSLYDILFPIPPLVEQQRLVECIESIFAMLQ